MAKIKDSPVPSIEVPPPPPSLTVDYSRSGMVNHIIHHPRFSGISRSVECFDNQGHSNFRILTLHIEDGIVIRQDVSDPLASFEAMDRLNYWNDLAVINLNGQWLNGKTLKR